MIVTGVGRSGTSAVARVIHDQIGIPLALRQDTELFTEYFEDDDWHVANRRFVEGEITYNVWKRSVEILCDDRAHLPRWGFKDPRCSKIIGLYATMFPRATIVWCDRDLEDVEKSWVGRIGTAPELAAMEIQARHRALEGLFRHWYGRMAYLDMTEQRSDAWIRDQLGHL